MEVQEVDSKTIFLGPSRMHDVAMACVEMAGPQRLEITFFGATGLQHPPRHRTQRNHVPSMQDHRRVSTSSYCAAGLCSTTVGDPGTAGTCTSSISLIQRCAVVATYLRRTPCSAGNVGRGDHGYAVVATWLLMMRRRAGRV